MRRPAKRPWRSRLPLLAALIEGDDRAAESARAHYRARNEERNERIVLCIDCRLPMIHIDAGFWRCPYDRAGAHAMARRAGRNQ